MTDGGESNSSIHSAYGECIKKNIKSRRKVFEQHFSRKTTKTDTWYRAQLSSQLKRVNEHRDTFFSYDMDSRFPSLIFQQKNIEGRGNIRPCHNKIFLKNICFNQDSKIFSYLNNLSQYRWGQGIKKLIFRKSDDSLLMFYYQLISLLTKE